VVSSRDSVNLLRSRSLALSPPEKEEDDGSNDSNDHDDDNDCDDCTNAELLSLLLGLFDLASDQVENKFGVHDVNSREECQG